jgi:hypothetical protein
MEAYSSTRRVPPADSGRASSDPIASLRDLAALHDSGALTDDEFSLAKAHVLGQGGAAKP